MLSATIISKSRATILMSLAAVHSSYFFCRFDSINTYRLYCFLGKNLCHTCSVCFATHKATRHATGAGDGPCLARSTHHDSRDTHGYKNCFKIAPSFYIEEPFMLGPLDEWFKIFKTLNCMFIMVCRS